MHIEDTYKIHIDLIFNFEFNQLHSPTNAHNKILILDISLKKLKFTSAQ
jgi:hypothetical protein